jgi:hypothetical protein
MEIEGGGEAEWVPSSVLLSSAGGSRIAYVGCRTKKAAKSLLKACRRL